MESNQSLTSPFVGATPRFPRVPGPTPLQRASPFENPESDIYRGSTPQLPEAPRPIVRVSSPDTASSRHSSPSTPFASIRLVARAIAAIVELAIPRWARPSASTTSSSSTTSSAPPAATWKSSRHRRRPNIVTSTVNTDSAQRALARQALENVRRIPREFSLLLPNASEARSQNIPSSFPGGRPVPQQDSTSRLIQTTSLPLILSSIERALRDANRLRHEQHKSLRMNSCLHRAKPAPANFLPAAVVHSPAESSHARCGEKAFEGGTTTTSPRVGSRSSVPPVTVALTKSMSPASMDSVPEMKNKGGHAEKPSSKHHHSRPLMSAGIGTGNFSNTNLGTRKPTTQATTGNRSSGTPPEVDSTILGNLWQKAWWLDVASPTWEDMRMLGTLLHLHPRTLEDILQQNPREKVEIFPRLGYYFVVIRSVDLNNYLAERDREQLGDDGRPQNEEDIPNVTNVYITVFREGICSFHFSDLSEHVNRVRNKILQMNNDTTIMTSDHITHGLMDSIVDAYIPVIKRIGHEVENVDRLVTGMQDEDLVLRDWETTLQHAEAARQREVEPEAIEVIVDLNEKRKESLPISPTSQPRRSAWNHTYQRSCSTLQYLFRPISCYLSSCGSACVHRTKKLWLRLICPRLTGQAKWRAVKFARTQTLIRMSRTRRTVTLLIRLLAPKNEVLGILRDRLTGVADLGAHLDDVQDHLLTMQQSLAHYERVLAHSQPTYLSGLGVNLAHATNRADSMLLKRSAVHTADHCMQVATGAFPC
ncbi:uncharacterized protein EI90DRAFT_2217071 [Cantharellus anzutake]|uniref:uncharacterized protein n=1 Tax=Cantharellus anzutake TaxID=1750568 RepID=UPI00190585F5|nr:uncharacterized protein EI90DRAFT_2217071 [Cantharellus anzutake]KAF8324881.1 hypothetical protein EI90DRAFT_2217071 [Cantharellus anzutake]